ncbi:TetR/AcrR family transcriptional regulator [bacterium]|nr:TetR/AcrR family transcriptional regulator [bacterium]
MGAQKKSQSEMTFIEKHRRKQIIDTAIEIIARDGYHQATLASVAKEAGFSKGVIFYYFKNKDELTEQINEILLDELRDHTRKCMKEEAPQADNLKAYVEAYLDFIRKNREKFAILVELGINLNQKMQDQLFSSLVYIDCRKSLAVIMDRDGKRDNLEKKTADALVVVVQAMLDGLGIQYLSDPKNIDLDACQQVILSMIASYQP